MPVIRAGRSIARRVGARGAGRGMGKFAVPAIIGGAGIYGFSKPIGESAISGAMDIAFDNPEADRSILGTDLTPSLLLAGTGAQGFPFVTGAARAMNMGQFGTNMGSGVVLGTSAAAGVGRSFTGWKNWIKYSWRKRPHDRRSNWWGNWRFWSCTEHKHIRFTILLKEISK